MKTIDVRRCQQPRRAYFARTTGAAFDVRALDGLAEIDIYDEIGVFGVSAPDVRAQLRGINAKKIVVNVNSPGGDVFDGIAIYNDLLTHPAQIDVRITGVAASAASIIAMAGDRVEIAANAFLMIHNAWAMAIGDRIDLRDAADILEQVDAALSGTYAARTGIDPAEIATMMDNETWMDGEMAVDRGFADYVTSKEAAVARFDLSIYANAPQILRAREQPASLPQTRRDAEKWLMHDAGLTRAQAREVILACKTGTDDVTHDADESANRETVETLTRLRQLLTP